MGDAFVGVAWQNEDVEGAQPGDDVGLAAGHGDAVGEVELGDLGLEVCFLGAVADDHQAAVRHVGRREGVEKVGVALPGAQRGDNAEDEGVFRQAEGAAGFAAVARREAVGVDAGRHRGDALLRQEAVGGELLDDGLASGHHEVAAVAVDPAAGEVARHVGRDMPGAHHARAGLEAEAGQSHHPGIDRRMGVDHIRSHVGEKAPHGTYGAEPLAPKRHGDGRHAIGRRRLQDLGAGIGGDRHFVAVLDEHRRFGQHADLLAAPAFGRLGVQDGERSIGHWKSR